MQNDETLVKLINSYMTQSGARAKETLDNILNIKGAALSVYDMVYSQNGRAALKALADIAKKKNGRETLAPLIRRDADKLLSLRDDKARKTAYKLIGICAPDECADKLAQALKAEKTRFARPSAILALGNTTDPARYLLDYKVETGEQKHMEEEKLALKKALGKSAEPVKKIAVKYPAYCLLTYINHEALKAELEARKSEYSLKNGMFSVRFGNTKNLRCYSERLFFIGNARDYAAAAKALDDMGLRGLSFRTEAGNVPADKRRDAIRGVSKGLEAFGYIDNPSAYAFEIRLLNSRMYAVFPDERFGYRKQSVAAGINPVAAASVMRICRPYMRENADVLDPYCGGGTMLIERELILKTKSLTGIDISPYAVRAACANRKASGVNFAVILKDCLAFKNREYDEVISNMPFGIRVSNHAENKKLYYGFAEKLPCLLKEGGYAFLFTQEKKLLADALSKQYKLSLLREESISTGGLSPSLFIIKKG